MGQQDDSSPEGATVAPRWMDGLARNVVAGKERDRLGTIDFYLGEPNEQVRESIRAMLRSAGLKRLRTFSQTDDLLNAIKERMPDVLAVADDLDKNIFQTIRDIRHNRFGANPFVLISVMVTPGEEDGIKRALLAGADDVLMKPVAPGPLMNRTWQVAGNRLPFIATTDYIGPERRRNSDRPSKIPQINVVNTLKKKLEGKSLNTSELAIAVAQCMVQVRLGQLRSFALKLKYHADLVAKDYEGKTITEKTKKNVSVLLSTIDAASSCSMSLKRKSLADAANTLGAEIKPMLERYEELTGDDLKAISTLAERFELMREKSDAEEGGTEESKAVDEAKAQEGENSEAAQSAAAQ